MASVAQGQETILAEEVQQVQKAVGVQPSQKIACLCVRQNRQFVPMDAIMEGKGRGDPTLYAMPNETSIPPPQSWLQPNWQRAANGVKSPVRAKFLA